MRTVFVDPARCVGCHQCEFACAVEHSASKDAAAAISEVPLPRSRIDVQPGPVPTTAFPNRCRHCDPAPCLSVCPTGAMSRDAEHALVLVDDGRCIGCAMCAVVCPFDTLVFDPVRDGADLEAAVALKCDGCVERLERGAQPACVEACKVGALVYGELNELLARGRLRQTRLVLAASGAEPTEPVDPLAGWHAWGAAEAAERHSAEKGYLR